MARHARRRKKQEGHEDGERWMVTYADMITLLLVFFIILYSMSSLQVDRFNALVNSLKSAFSGNAIVNQSMNPPTTTFNVPVNQNKMPHSQQQTSPQSTESQQDKQQLDKLYSALESYIKKNHLQADIQLQNLPVGVQVTVKDHILFDLGKANIKPSAMKVLEKIGGILDVVNNPIVVEGYTDNTPIGPGSQFASNWDLSGARSENVMLYLINVEHIKPARMSFVGYGEFHPLVPNDNKADKAINRRVNIVIQRLLSTSNQVATSSSASGSASGSGSGSSTKGSSTSSGTSSTTSSGKSSPSSNASAAGSTNKGATASTSNAKNSSTN